MLESRRLLLRKGPVRHWENLRSPSEKFIQTYSFIRLSIMNLKRLKFVIIIEKNDDLEFVSCKVPPRIVINTAFSCKSHISCRKLFLIMLLLPSRFQKDRSDLRYAFFWKCPKTPSEFTKWRILIKIRNFEKK